MLLAVLDSMWDPDHMGSGWWMGGFAMMVLFFVTIGVVVWAVLRMDRRSSIPDPPERERQTSLEILEARFARGEIQKDEYTDKKAAILSSGRG